MTHWRTGYKLGRTLYRDEVCIGMLDTPALADEVVAGMTYAAQRATDEAEVQRLRDALAAAPDLAELESARGMWGRRPERGQLCDFIGRLMQKHVEVLKERQELKAEVERLRAQAFAGVTVKP